jgi:hypothetical protein
VGRNLARSTEFAKDSIRRDGRSIVAGVEINLLRIDPELQPHELNVTEQRSVRLVHRQRWLRRVNLNGRMLGQHFLLKPYPHTALAGFAVRHAPQVLTNLPAKLAIHVSTYLQIDDTMFATLSDPEFQRKLNPRAGVQERLHMTYIRLLNESIAQKPPAMTLCVHTCRGNHRSAWVAAGGYDPLAEAVFNELNVDAFFLEYDDARSGTFEPLRFVPKGKTVVLGLITSKKGALEKKDGIKRRIDAATKYIPLDQLALSPQCGFASTSPGNLLTEDEQFAKLALVVEIAKEVWGE